ncbi:MAG: DUF11 domain-containing protein [Bacteroidetes bacterium]|nr:DUF11 domain-containing protein [Bacteroidota bacterium]
MRGKRIQLGIIIIGCLLGGKATAQALVPEEFPFLKPVSLMKVRQGKLCVIQTLNENTDGGTYQLSIKTGNTWKPYPSLKLMKSLGRKVEFTDVAFTGGRIYLSGIFQSPASSKSCVVWIDVNNVSNGWKADLDFSYNSSGAVVNALAFVQNTLYIGGFFNKVNQTECLNLAKLDKTYTLSAVRSGNVNGVNGMVNDLAVDSSQAGLFIAGRFDKALGTSRGGLAYLKDTVIQKDVSKSFNSINKLAVMGGILAMVVEDDTNKLRKICVYNYVLQKASIQSSNDTIFAVNSLFFLNKMAYFCGSSRPAGTTRRQGLFHYTGSKIVSDLEKLSRLDYCELFNGELYTGGAFFNFLTNFTESFTVARINTDAVRFTGRVFHDKDNSGTYSFNEQKLPGRMVRISPSKNLIPVDKNGYFTLLFSRSAASTFSLKIENTDNQFSNNFVYTFRTDTFGDRLVDFPCQFRKSNFSDMRLTLTSPNGWLMRRDTSEYYYVTVANTGITNNSANIDLHFNSKIKNIVTDPPADVINAGKLTWKSGTLNPGEEKTVKIKMTASSADFSNSQQVLFSAEAVPAADDNNENNSDSLQQQLTQYLPPAAKFQDPPIATGDSFAWFNPAAGKLDYIIRFTNTGTDTLNTVVVRDTVNIPDYVSYVQETGSSHNFTRNVYSNPNMPGKAILVYTFSNIKLPPNPNGNPEVSASTGFIGFRLGIDPNLIPVSTSIRNRASIYQDYGSPLLTNTVVAKAIANHVQVPVFSRNTIAAYPNPCSGLLTLQGVAALSQAEVFTLTGQKVMEQNSEGNALKMNTMNLKPGLYIWTAKSKFGMIEKGIFEKN